MLLSIFLTTVVAVVIIYTFYPVFGGDKTAGSPIRPVYKLRGLRDYERLLVQ